MTTEQEGNSLNAIRVWALQIEGGHALLPDGISALRVALPDDQPDRPLD